MARLPDPAVRQRWIQLIQLHQQSNLTIAEFCHLHDVSAASFYLWRKKLRSAVDQDTAFLAVQVSPTPPQPGSTRVLLPCGTKIEINSGDTQSLGVILDRLAPAPLEAHP